ncbi:MAG: NAD(P)/FAD-dependent oxidoreductase [Prevotella sp.]
MIHEYDLRLLPQQAYNEMTIREAVAREKAIDARTICCVRVLRKSIDARQRTIYVNLRVRVYVNEMPTDEPFRRICYGDVSAARPVVVVGAGPGGLFAALRLIELGLKPVVIERGRNVRDRKRDLAEITRRQRVEEESNYCFGEGGAGAYSDGKLYTRSKKRGSTEKILHVFCQHGASPSILSDAHPHIGTDKLPGVIESMRQTILEAGGEVHFCTRMERLMVAGNQVTGVEATDLETGVCREYRGPVILATGHSARDVYRHLSESQVEMEAKGIAVGVRLEHPSALIDQIQYHSKNGRGRYLPPAEYSFVTQVDGRGVYSFCMCPGGFVIPAATGRQQIVVNGMSPSNRGTQWSNSGMVVELHPEDLAQAGASPELQCGPAGALCMMHFQEQLERMCWQQGNMKQTAPAQRMDDFVNRRLSYDLPRSSYAPGLISSPLHFWMPPFVADRLRQGFLKFGKASKGFLTHEAVLIAVETRTSSPVRILRDSQTLQHMRLAGLYPCGEGAGYAGGIVSAAVDGERCAEMCAAACGL